MEENKNSTENFDEKFFKDTDAQVQENQESMTAPNNASVSPFSWGGYFEAIGLVFLMLFVMYAFLLFLKKKGKGTFLPMPSNFSRADLRVEAQLQLAPKKTLYVVKYLNKRLLIGSSDQNLSLLTEDFVFEDEDENVKTDENKELSAEKNKDTKKFKAIVERFTEKNT